MSCQICQEDLSGALMVRPCCQTTVHTLCGIKNLGSQLMNGYTAHCSCGSLQYTTAPDYDDSVSLPDTPAFVEAVKNCNKFRILASKASIQFKRLVREKKKLFSEQIENHFQTIKAIKKAEIADIRSSDIFKAYNKTQSTYKKAYTKIIRDFHLNTFACRRKLRLRLNDMRSIWRRNGSSIIAYAFRRRI